MEPPFKERELFKNEELRKDCKLTNYQFFKRLLVLLEGEA